jgi:hypothetical protein
MSYIKAEAFCTSVSKAIGFDENGIGITHINISAAPAQLVTVEITLLLTPAQLKQIGIDLEGLA